MTRPRLKTYLVTMERSTQITTFGTVRAADPQEAMEKAEKKYEKEATYRANGDFHKQSVLTVQPK